MLVNSQSKDSVRMSGINEWERRVSQFFTAGHTSDAHLATTTLHWEMFKRSPGPFLVPSESIGQAAAGYLGGVLVLRNRNYNCDSEGVEDLIFMAFNPSLGLFDSKFRSEIALQFELPL